MSRKKKHIAINFEMQDRAQYAAMLYLKNFIKGILLLPEDIRPEITIIYGGLITENDLADLKGKGFHFFHARDVYRNPVKRFINKISRTVIRKNLLPFVDRHFPAKHIDIIYPCPSRPEIENIPGKIFWKPDFQEKYFPEYFSEETRINFDHNFRKITDNKNHVLVLSSEDSLNDLRKFFPDHQCSTFVLPFVVFDENYSNPLGNEFKNQVWEKFNIKSNFILVPNQLWPHKNHALVIEAMHRLNLKGECPFIVFTGHTSSERNKKIFSELSDKIKEYQLESKCCFTGFLSKEEQIVLYKSSSFVLQPSLFEGWNTSVEECKAMNKFILCSDIPLHIEQIQTNCAFFKSKDADDLASQLRKYFEQTPEIIAEDYRLNQQRFSERIAQLFQLP